MTLLIWFLTAVLVLDCAFLILLILVQLPKKEAGAGLAFGGSATDALFGAGSGNALTKITKYAATIFFCLALALSVITTSQARNTKATAVEEKLKEKATKTLPSTAPMNQTAPQFTPSAETPAPSAPALQPQTPAPAPAAETPQQ